MPSDLSIGIITALARPDAAVALALLHGLQGKREARAGAVCVAGAGLGAAVYCDVVRRFYAAGAVPGTNDVLPIGLALSTPLPADPPMVLAALERKNTHGEPQYPRGIRKLTDTALAEAVLRNGVTQAPVTAFVLSGPATPLARTLDLHGVRELYRERAPRLVIVDAGEPHRDVPALRRLLAEWPTSVFLCGAEVGEGLRFPGASIERDFSWTAAHPVVDAYRAVAPMPYDAPGYDLAAVYFAAHPDEKVFQLSEPGSAAVTDDGRIAFGPGGSGRVRRIGLVASMRADALRAIVERASARPVSRRSNG